MGMFAPDVVVILNPTAGRYFARRHQETLQQILEQVCSRAGCSWRVEWTNAPGHAIQLARRAAETGAQIVVAAGGDGTCNEVANGLLGTSARMGVIPLGTGNDFARHVGIPGDLRQAVETLVRGRAKRIDLGMVNGRYFVNIAGCGLDAAVAQRVNQGFRYLRGTAAYVAALLQTLYTFRPTQMRVTVDGQRWEERAFLCTVANTDSYGGGMRIAPDASVEDGLLDVCVAGAVSKLELLWVFPRVYRGAHVTHPRFYLWKGRYVQVETDPPVPVLVDGDVLGSTPAVFTVHAQALEVVIPGGKEEPTR